MLDLQVTEAGLTDWTSLIVLETKIYGTLRCFIDQSRLNTLTVLDGKPMLQMDVCIDMLAMQLYIRRLT